MNKNELARFRKVLTEEKSRLLELSRNSIKNEDLAISSDDLPDETDLAAIEVNQNLLFKLRDRERQMLSRLEAALSRIEEGIFGECEDCEDGIEPRRLEAQPTSTLCLACKEMQEHRDKVYA